MPRLFATLALLAVLVAGAARADGVKDVLYEVKGGLLHHDPSYLWSHFRRESGVDFNAEAVFAPAYPILGGAIRPALGGSVNSAGDTSKAYLDAKWELDSKWGGYLNIGLGAAIHDGDLDLKDRNHKALGSRVLFHIPLEVGYRFDGHQGVSLYFDHVSNGYLASPNEGLDTIGVRYGYRF